MPLSGTPAPPNTKKKPFKIITDLSNITQIGQYALSVCFYLCIQYNNNSSVYKFE